MMDHISYKPKGVCSSSIEIDVENGTVQELSVIGGCHGNLQGIAALCKNQPVEYVIERLEGICCQSKKTSCPDQIAKALKTYQNA